MNGQQMISMRHHPFSLPRAFSLCLGLLVLVGCAPKHKPVPAKLGIPEIRDGMEQLREPVHECYEEHQVPGHAQVTVRIEADGSVSSVKLGEKFSGTPSGECVRKVVLGHRFPKFKQGPIVIQYPLLLR
jgi:hypothetical protein